MRIVLATLLTALLAGGLADPDTVTIHLAGDSTMAEKRDDRRPETGWGERLSDLLTERTRVVNHAANGRSTKSFIAEGRWEALLDELTPGDYVVIQFGHNDASSTHADRFTPPDEFERNLERFVADVTARHAHPLLLTPVMRRRFDERGQFYDAHGSYPDIVRRVAARVDVPLIDMHRLSEFELRRHGSEGSKSLFLHLAKGAEENYPDGLTDDTHFSWDGAALHARLFAEALRAHDHPLADVLRDDLRQRPAPFRYSVAQDGSGDFATVQEAFDAVPSNHIGGTTILVRRGVYHEKLLLDRDRVHVTLLGEDRDAAILTYDDYSGRVVDGDTITTSTSYSVAIDADDFVVRDITFQNTSEAAQAVALRVRGDRMEFHNVRMLGFQDTYYTWGGGRLYHRDCYIEGTVDFIFGRSIAVFEDCTLHSKRNSPITAASTEENYRFGYVFLNATLTADAGIDRAYLGRPWRPHARTVFIGSHLGAHIHRQGWLEWRGNENHETASYAEYENCGPGFVPDARVSWARMLTDEDASAYSLERIFGRDARAPAFENDWMPGGTGDRGEISDRVCNSPANVID